MIKDTCLSHKQRFQLRQRLQRKAFSVSVNFVVAELDVEEKDFFFCESTSGELIQLFQLFLYIWCRCLSLLSEKRRDYRLKM